MKTAKPRKPLSPRNVALIVTAAVVVAGLAAASFFAFRGQQAPSPIGATSSAVLPTQGSGAAGTGTGAATGSESGAAAAAPVSGPISAADLEKAADNVGFYVTLGSDVGRVENLPADALLPAPSRTLLPVGSQAPDFTLFTPQGESVSLSDYRGRTVLLEFFATWCPHCQAEALHFPQLRRALPEPEYSFLSVNANSEDAASVRAYERHFGITWPTLLDPGSPPGSFHRPGGLGPVSKAYGIGLFPTFYVIDKEGRVAWRADREQPDALIIKKMRDAAGS